MALLRLILGRAGSGKTYTCLSEIAERVEKDPMGSPLVLLVPDQATFQAERALAACLSHRGYSRARVLSFNRLAIAILAEQGGLAQPELSPLGRQMLLRALLLKHRDELQVFARAARQPGFVVKLELALQELTRYNHSPDHMALAASKLPGTVIQKKLTDLGFLWKAFHQALAERQAGSDAYLQAAIAKGPQASLVQEADIWVDGFAGFTPLEQSLLSMLIRHARTVHIALCMDPTDWRKPCVAGEVTNQAPTDPLHLFARTQATCAQVCMVAQAAQVPLAEPLLLRRTPRFIAPELAHLEAEFGKLTPQPYLGSPTSVHIAEAANRWAEVEAVGLAILRLCREKGYRFRDMAIITRDLTPYHDILSAVFTDLGIPFFVDRRALVAHHPVVELLRSGIETIASRWDIRPLMRCLKTDLLPFTRDEIDQLENYALEHGLRGGAWQTDTPWTYGLRRSPGGLTSDEQQTVQQLDTLRRRVTQALAPLTAVFTQRQILVREGCQALYAFLEQTAVPERLQEWVTQSAETGALQESLTHQQVWDACMALLEQMVEALGDTVMNTGEFSQVLEAGLENLHLGLIPPALDQVLVGSVDRSRQPHLRAAFIMGVGERSFPATGNEDSMFNDTERELLSGMGFELGPTAIDQALQEQYLGYIAFTRAAEHLVVSYPLASEDGRALAPSPFVTKLRAMFPGLQLERVGNEPGGSVDQALPWLVSRRRLAAALVRRVQPSEDRVVQAGWRSVADLLSDDHYAQRLLASLEHSHAEAPLDGRVAATLAGELPLRSSISRLESFAACPFQHFAQYLLRLRERQEYHVQFTDVGLLVHETLHRFVQLLQKQQIDWACLSNEEAVRIADHLVDEIAPRLRSEVFLSSARYKYLVERMKRMLHTALWVWGQHAQRGQYRPIATELPFGSSSTHAGLPEFEVDLLGGGKLHLHGRIDRVDACQGTEGLYLRVIDYKGSGTGFSLIDLYHGLRLQLIVYLDVALRAAAVGYLPGPVTMHTKGEPRAVRPGGAYYFNVREPLVHVTKPLEHDALEKEILKNLRVKGLTLGTPEAITLAEENGAGQLIPARLTKAGSPYSHALTIQADAMEQLMDLAEYRMAESAGRILAGEVSAAPFRYPGGANACRFCRYHMVCHFDPQIPGDHYRPLEHRDNRRAWELIRALSLPKRGDYDGPVDQ